MASGARVRVDDAKMRADLTGVRRKAAKRAASSALNEAARKARSFARKAAAKDIGTSEEFMSRRLIVVNSKPRKLSSLIIGLLDRVRAGDLLGAAENAKGVRVGSHQFDGAFIANVGEKKNAVMIRKGKPRLPIRHVSIDVREKLDRLLHLVTRLRGVQAFKREFDKAMAAELRKNRVV